MRYLIGIDDTDSLESRGTGHRVLQLADFLAEHDLALPLGMHRISPKPNRLEKR